MSFVALGDLMAERVPSLDPSRFLDEKFELWSIPAFDAGKPEIAGGDQIGSSKKMVEPDDVLLSRIVPHIRRAWVVSEKQSLRQIASGEWIVFRDKRFHPKYLRHILTSDPFHADFMKTVAGVGGSLVRARPEGVRSIEIPLPPLEEQKRIAVILDQADALRRHRARALDRLNALGQAIFHEMFGDPVANEKNLPMVRLGEVCDVRDGTHDSPKYVEDGHPLLTSKNFSSGFIDYTGAKLIARSDFEKINQRSKVDKGDIVMPMIGTIGSPVMIDIEPDFAIKNVALIKFTKSHIKAQYVQTLLSGSYLDRVVDRQGKGGTQKFLSLSDIRNLTFPLPNADAQCSFNDAMAELRRQVAVFTKANVQSAKLFEALQSRAFAGQL